MTRFSNAPGAELLTVSEMGRADRMAVELGVPSERLMEAAGAAVAAEIERRFPPRPTVVLCGPGNNGGDGFVIARYLQQAGWAVRLALLGRREALKGDAALNAGRWSGEVLTLSPAVLDGAGLVVDAVFGAGLARPLDGLAAEIVAEIGRRGLDCVGVDVPSGVDGDTGAVLAAPGSTGLAPRCRLTVTFFRYKPGHFLFPGRDLAGELVVADIGIPEAVLARIAPRQFLNGPALWGAAYPWPRGDGHKYDRGHAVVVGGDTLTGAGRLAVRAALRVGAGLVSLAASPPAIPIYAADSPSALMAPLGDEPSFAALLADPRRNAVLVGPGNGVSPATRARVLAALGQSKACVLDADALTVFESAPETLFRAITAPCLMTPHDGEYRRLFRTAGDRLARARAGAAESGAVVLLKGSDTVIAAPDGRAAINANAPPDLATGGTGDVLAGLCVGLLAQGVPPFEAGCIAAWLHGEAAAAFGPGLIAADLPDMLPAVLKRLKAMSKPQA